jgi:uncharacterized OB-fold protein
VEVRLARKGKIHTYANNVYMPFPFDAPLPIIIGDMSGGTQFPAMGTEMKTEDLKIGNHIELVLRVAHQERGSTAYVYKFRPPRIMNS